MLPNIGLFSIVWVTVALFLPGYGLWRALAASRARSLLFAPLGSAAVLGGLAMVLGLLHLPWHWGTVLAGCVVVWVLVAVVMVLVRGRKNRGLNRGWRGHFRDVYRRPVDAEHPIPWHGLLVALLSAGIGGYLISTRLRDVMSGAGSFPQRFDVLFHLNAVRFILDTGSASSLTLGTMISPSKSYSFYPALWHSLGALAMGTTHDDVFVATNAVILVVCCVVWPLALVTAVGTITGFRPLPLVVAGVGSAAFSSFPFALLNYGPLLPNILSLSLLPLAVAVMASLTGVIRRLPTSRGQSAVVVLATVGALGVAQPNALATLLVATALMVGCRSGWRIRRAAENFTHPSLVRGSSAGRYYRKLLIGIIVILATVAVFALIWTLLQTDYNRRSDTGLTTAVGQALLLAPNGRDEIPWAYAIGSISGLIVAVWRRKYLWLALLHVSTLVLYIYAAGAPDADFRTWLVGPWYEDSPRLAALFAMTGVMLTAILVTSVADVFFPLHIASDRVMRWRAPSELVVGVVLCILMLPATQEVPFRTMDVYLREAFHVDAGSYGLTPDEHALLTRLDRDVPEDALIGVNPWTGASLAYGVADRHVTSPHIFTHPTPAEATVSKDLGDPSASAEACSAVRESGIDYVLDFGDRALVPSTPGRYDYPAYSNVHDVPGDHYEEIDRQGGSVLYKVVGCG
ncbi:DUF6541 family protein [Kocuria sp.]|uniref:DUF6541 family protein n=1 Tax=Kocuria sp. TaxID=1871328 RepID=UPI0026DDAD25|nr:DUF6541 family protein [Kocuria sp.]MDO4918632.1 hypothetical protein [Kocuria sp.]